MRSFVALAEIDRLRGLRHVVGHSGAVAAMEALAAKIEQSLAGCQRIRVGRNRLEIELVGSCRDEVASNLARVAVDARDRMTIEGFEFDVTPIIGGADSEARPISDELIERAEEALGLSRRLGAVQVLGPPDALDQPVDRLIVMRALQQAIRQDRLELHYQPKVRARTGQTASVEALLRWPTPTGANPPPDFFIPLAEETGDIRTLTQWVISRAIEDQKALHAAGFPIAVHVNLSGALLAHRDCEQDVLACSAGSSDFGLEITETAMIADPDRALVTLQAFSEAGIHLAIDDYGSGFSSLAYLQQLPVDEIKIDKMFVSRLSKGQRDPLLVRSTIDLAHALEMEVTAEGVDSPTIAALLQVMGCDMLQGYHLSPALPIPALQDFLAAERARGLVEQTAAVSHPLKRRNRP